MQGQHVAVGLNGTPVSFDAVRWAAWASQQTRVPLRVVHVFTTELGPEKDSAELRAASESWHRSQATGWLRAALGDSGALAHGNRLELREGSWPEVLLSAHRPDTSFVVIGMTPDAVRQVSAHATRLRCPVVLVPATTPAADAPDGEATQTRSRLPRTVGVSR
jgi:hypothetical protein